VYSESVQTPKGTFHKKKDDSNDYNAIGISQEKPFPKYSPIKRWFAEKKYRKNLLKIVADFKPDIVISGNTPLDIQLSILPTVKKKISVYLSGFRISIA
jgi:colanic acid biosynthesis glycosyl transferase WcaI